MKIEPPVLAALTNETEKTVESAPASAIGNLSLGQALALPQPVYSKLARAAHAKGTVVVQVVLDEHGNVISEHAISGHPLLLPASEAAARETKFKPTTLCGEPVRVTGVITYNFVEQ